MPQASNADTGDFEKLQLAFAEITTKFGSLENVLEAFGLSEMPVAQRYGIFFGFMVFILTITAVMSLLFMGGSFERMAEQADTGKSTVQTDYRNRMERPLLLERLLDASERLLDQNYPNRPKRKEGLTNLTKMLINVAPPKEVQDNKAKSAVNSKKERAEVMEGYKENFVMAYRKCQDKPGGAVIPGKPEAHFEAYARGYAGCGDDVSLSYRRSYARLYEAVCCESGKADDKFTEIFTKSPESIVGKWCRLEALDAKHHLKPLYDATSGEMHHYKKWYEPTEVWGFLEDGPFRNAKELHQSFVFQHYDNQAGFVIIQNISDRLLGVAMLNKDDPTSLSIQLEPPIVGPSGFGSQEQMESCFLLMDRLFGNGYRRIQISIDTADSQGQKLVDRLGFTLEGCLLKDMVIKDSSRDSNIYGMLNSDWDKGARMSLYKKLYGLGLARADVSYNQKEEELDEQQRVLAEKKLLEDVEKNKDKNA